MTKRKRIVVLVVGCMVAVFVGYGYSALSSESNQAIVQEQALFSDYKELAHKGLDELRTIAREDMARHEEVTVNEVDGQGNTLLSKTVIEADYRAPSIAHIFEQVGKYESQLEEAHSLNQVRRACKQILDVLVLEARHHRDHHDWSARLIERRTVGLLKKYWAIKERDEPEGS